MSAVFLLQPDAVAHAAVANKRESLARISRLFAASYGLNEAEVLESLEERESLGSTGFGHGVAIPHARMEGISRPVAAVLRLDAPIDFAAADAMPVELVFGLLSPTDCGATHLHALAAISRLVRSDSTLQLLLDAPNADALVALLTDFGLRDAA